MARKRSFLGKNPGGRSRGIPGNPSNGMGWGGVFKKKGDWGILNPSEWTSLGSRQKFGNIGPRPQGQLQSIIDYNLGMDQQMRQQPTQRQAPSDTSGVVKIPKPPYSPVVMAQPTSGGSGGGSGGGGSTGGGGGSGIKTGGPAQPKGGSTAPAGGKNTGTKTTSISSTVKAIKNPSARVAR